MPVNLLIKALLYYQEPPFITKIETEDGVRYEGYTIDILDEIARRLSFEYSFHYVQDGEYGVLRSDGTWSGIIGEVARGVSKTIQNA